MNLGRLQTFVTVVEAGTFAAAAEALSFTPSAVSQQMSKLEAEVGASLLRRGPGAPGRKMELTEAGRRLYAHAVTISAAVDEARRAVASIEPEQPDRLRLGSFPGASSGILAEALQRLRSRLPGLQCEVVESDPWDEVRRRGVDLALCARIGSATLPGDPAIAAVRLARAALIVVLPAWHPLARRDAVPLAALDGLPLLGGPALPELASVRAACDAVGSHPVTTAWSMTHPLALAALAAAGEGLAIVPPTLAGVSLAGTVARPLANGPAWELLVLRPHEPPLATAAALVEELRAVLATRPLLRPAVPAPAPIAA
jgi:DNA-binding transcriptional LysR family regulator